MTDFLKRSISQRRQEFDLYETDLELSWEEIGSRLDSAEKAERKKALWQWPMRVAASVLLISALTLALVWQRSGSAQSINPTLSMVSPEMAETEHYYSLKISEKLDEINAQGPYLDAAVLEDLKLLDQAYSELRTDLADNLQNEEVVNAMIINYKIKLEVLDRILAQIKEVKNGEKAKNSTL